MNQIDKKLRFVDFIVKSIQSGYETLFKNFQKIKIQNYPIVFKLRIRDIKLNLFFIIEKDTINIINAKKIKKRVNCFITINRARTLHNLLRGKILLTNTSLIRKLVVNSYNQKYPSLFYILITSLKKSYNEIIKGTRFTLIEN